MSEPEVTEWMSPDVKAAYEQGRRVARRERRWSWLRLRVLLLRERLAMWIDPWERR